MHDYVLYYENVKGFAHNQVDFFLLIFINNFFNFSRLDFANIVFGLSSIFFTGISSLLLIKVKLIQNGHKFKYNYFIILGIRPDDKISKCASRYNICVNRN
ncbi:MAG: hypothetical protein CM15mP86_00050 [Gammaproteobacteria bacterium]|nr:MAG: hypothetical protein CM15mP86_00050 [Gammaproteobacteria bacterium]